MVLSFCQTGELLDALADRFPQALFDGLNGGVSLLEDTVPDPDFPPGEMYILGEYCDGLLGRYINLYYGSFAALAEQEDWDGTVWRQELWTTLSHELTHHMEGRSGLHALDDRDGEEAEAWRRDRRSNNSPSPDSQNSRTCWIHRILTVMSGEDP